MTTPPFPLVKKTAPLWGPAIACCLLIFAGAWWSSARVDHLHRSAEATLRVLNLAQRLETASVNISTARNNLWVLAQQWRTTVAQLDAAMTTLAAEEQGLFTGEVRRNWLQVKSAYAVLQRNQRRTEAALEALHERHYDNPGGQPLILVLDDLENKPQLAPAFPELIEAVNQFENFKYIGSFFTDSLDNLSATLHPHIDRQLRLTMIAAFSLLAFLVLAATGFILRITSLNRALGRDNTARREAEAAARTSEQDLRITLDSIGDAVIATDLSGRITRINPIAAQLTGWPPVEAAGRHLAEVFRIQSSDGQPVDNPVAEVLRQGEIIGLANDTVLLNRHGPQFQIADSAAPIRDSEGVLRGVVLVFRDVSGQYKLEAQMRQAQRLEPLGRLAAGVAHDFNNILQAIRGNAALARDPAMPPGELPELLTNIEQATQRAAELTGQLLAFSRRQNLHKAPHDLNVICADILKMVRRLIGADIAVQFEPAPEPAPVLADRIQLEQVIMNLCVNSRDAMPGGGRLTLQITRHELDAASARAHPGTAPGPFFRLQVSDTGQGIEPRMLERIFEPFFTTKEAGRGTGLGLAVVAGIIQQHYGYVEVESTPGQGSTFSVHLPAQPLASAPPPPAAPAELRAPAHRPQATLLLAEDDPSVRLIASLVLRRAGYQIIEAGDGEEACRIADQRLAEIDGAVCDVMMPGRNGFQVRQHLRSRRPGLPVVLCSGYTGGIAHDLPADVDTSGPVLQKPYSPQDLLQAIQHAFDAAPPSARASLRS